MARELPDLQACREAINEIDEELVALFVRRMKVAADIAAVKRAAGKPVYDPAREEKVLQRVSALAGEPFAGYARAMYTELMRLSRAYQTALIEEAGKGEPE